MTATSIEASVGDDLSMVPCLVSTLRRCIDKELTRSAQAFVLHDGKVVASGAVGETSLGTPASGATSYVWNCAVKPLVAVLVASFVDEGEVAFDDPIGRFVAELPAPTRDLLVADLLMHTAGLSDAAALEYDEHPRDSERGHHEAALDAVMRTPVDPDIGAHKEAAYSVFTNWFLLAEIAERVVASPYTDALKSRVVDPLAIAGDLDLPRDEVRKLDRAPLEMLWDHPMAGMFRKADETPRYELGDGSEPHNHMPGTSGLGPISSLVSVVDAVMTDARDGTERLLSQPTAATMIAARRVGVRDKLLGNDLAWGLGFTVDRRAFSPALSDATFGHLALESSCVVFADPECGLAAGLVFDRQVPRQSGVLRHGASVGAMIADLEEAAIFQRRR